jgi:hypothetical protein
MAPCHQQTVGGLLRVSLEIYYHVPALPLWASNPATTQNLYVEQAVDDSQRLPQADELTQ